ncbi:MAG: hypothetical protein JWM80_4370, partial [Cyanobacteria bacterium RYN_339]|nr:hypothetical protein [Cyanobacteria bacterium RYN_339]
DADALARRGERLTAISAQPDLAGVLRTALASFVALAQADRGFLLRLAGFEVLDQVIHGAVPDAYSTSLADRVVWTGEPLVVEDLEAEGELAASVQELGLRMALGMPLLAQGKVIGVMMADGERAHPGFDAQTLAVARALADHVVAAIAAAERDRGHRDGEAVQAALARAALVAARAATLADALPAIAREAAAGLGAERMFICLGPDLACHAALDGDGRPLEGARPSLGAVRWVAEHGRPLAVVDASVDEAFAGRPSVQELALRAIHAAPLVVDDAVVGVLYLDSREPGRSAGRLLEGLAAIVAVLLARVGA